ncbi:BppU family phage baseplate upper protein [Bacillus thuringiensis]|uniref:BppU family phage baseplate upper protein n=1 Tax=Bacillus thuringiensis TaxID=1428 RepID=UPI003F7AFCF4
MQHKDFTTKEEELKLIRFYQNDLNSAKLLINVTHDKVVTDFSSAISVQIAFLKPDCKRVFQDVQNVNQMQGKYYVVLSTQTLIAYGNVIAQLRFTFPNNKVIETCKFAFTVDESIMSDEAMKSTNEFPVIQKAIEAGKKLEGVDIDGIIAAGELAKEALPKTGGTMTGNLILEGNRDLRLQNSANDVLFRNNASGVFAFFDIAQNQVIWTYNPATKEFNVNANTNLLKKTGDTITGLLTTTDNFRFKAGGERSITWRDGNDTEYIKLYANSGGNRLGLWSTKNNKAVWEYHGDNDIFNVTTNTNLLKRTEIYTNFTQPDGKTKAISTADLNTIIESGQYTGQNLVNAPEDSKRFFYVEVIRYAGTDTFRLQRATTLDDKLHRCWIRVMNNNVWQSWTEITSNSKDGTTNLIITSDFTPTSGAVQNIVRRGNSVTLMLDVTRNADSTNPIMTTLPEGLRPIGSLTTDVASTDGTMSRLLIRFNGEIHLDTKGKRYRILQTFVTN